MNGYFHSDLFSPSTVPKRTVDHNAVYIFITAVGIDLAISSLSVFFIDKPNCCL